jgi:hypothetical protein
LTTDAILERRNLRMPKFKIIAETEIIIEADTEEDATERFYDEVYEVDRHGITKVEVIE